MQNIPIYEALALAFAAEGVDTHFTLMGDGDMHWVSAMQNFPVVASVTYPHNVDRHDPPQMIDRRFQILAGSRVPIFLR